MNKKDNKKLKINSVAETDYSYMTKPVEISPEIIKFANKQFTEEEVEKMRELMEKMNEIANKN